jgi:hypothetical protein
MRLIIREVGKRVGRDGRRLSLGNVFFLDRLLNHICMPCVNILEYMFRRRGRKKETNGMKEGKKYARERRPSIKVMSTLRGYGLGTLRCSLGRFQR